MKHHNRVSAVRNEHPFVANRRTEIELKEFGNPVIDIEQLAKSTQRKNSSEMQL